MKSRHGELNSQRLVLKSRQAELIKPRLSQPISLIIALRSIWFSFFLVLFDVELYEIQPQSPRTTTHLQRPGNPFGFSLDLC